jgi:hypothetical protein
MVALVAAGARNGNGVMGIAYESTILTMRADSPGSCTASDGCRFSDTAIAAGIDRAVSNGAKVVNLSLGGSAAGGQTRAAVARAAAADVVVIVAAGNDADAATPSTDPNNPNPFATSLRGAGSGNVIIAGSVNSSGVLSAFSNRAGSEASWYLGALGEDICCEYANGSIQVTNINGQQYYTVYNGTSFSAPQIAGAVALLRQAFPNLTAVQAVSLLLSTAKDAGSAGTDSTYGRGILDIAAAFAPQGQSSLAGNKAAVPIDGAMMVTSAPMGDALANNQLKAIVLDSFARAYSVDMASYGRAAQPVPKLLGALASPLHQVEVGTDQLSLAFSVDPRRMNSRMLAHQQHTLSQQDFETPRVLAGRIVARLNSTTRFGFAYSQGASSLIAALRGGNRPAFLIASEPFDDVGFGQRGERVFAVNSQLGGWEWTFNYGTGQLTETTPRAPLTPAQRTNDMGVKRYGVALARRFGAVQSSLSMTWLDEGRTILGASFQDGVGGAGANSVFVDGRVDWQPSPQWRVGAAWRQGHTIARVGGLVSSGSAFSSSAWAIDATRYGLFKSNDSLSLRVSQPLRVVGGGLSFILPTAYSYETLSASNEVRRLNLAPHGHEIVTELGWSGQLPRGWLAGTLFYRKNPGHVAGAADDKGLALRWLTTF